MAGPDSPARGVVAAGHPRTASAGADVLRAGGNAVDAAIAAVLASFVAEPGLTGLAGGGYMLVAGAGGAETLLDFSVEAPGRGADPARRTELVPIPVTFGDVTQMFNAGPASVGAYGLPAGVCEAARRFGSLPLAELTAPAVAMAREGVALNASQAYVLELLELIVTSTEECAAVFAAGGRLAGEGDVVRQPDLADALELLAAAGAEPFYRGEVASAVIEWLAPRGAMLTAADLAAYRVIDRRPLRVAYRDRRVLTNPPPSAGGLLLAHALAVLDRAEGGVTPAGIVDAMARAQDQRTPEFLEGLSEEGFAERFAARAPGATTHVSVIDGRGQACAVTCSNGEGSGILVPGTGMHLNNWLGEHDLNPLGFHRHPPGRRMPSMMSPTVVLAGSVPELAVGSAGSNRIRSAILQTVLAVVENGLDAAAAVDAPRVHFEDGVVYAEPGADVSGLEAAGHTLAHFRERNLFFGGVQAARRDPATGVLSGAGDPRRGGAVEVVG
jgi:gamma-glutamyltranspeptidase/glutathione hydrolase